MEEKLSLILLAAGNSVRFQGNKLLSTYDGKALYLHAVDMAEALPPDTFQEKWIVTQYEEIIMTISSGYPGFGIVKNESSSLGISHSIQLGLKAAGNCNAHLFFVCDQPELKAETMHHFTAAWRKSGKPMGCLAYKGVPGNPVIFSGPYAELLWKLKGDTGGKQIIRGHMEEVFLFEADSPAELRDIDYNL